MRRGFRSQYLFWMRVECDHDRRSVGGPGVFGGSRDDGLVAEMDAVEDADGEKEWAGQIGQLRNRAQDLHHQNDE